MMSAALLACTQAIAGEFAVSPIRLDLGPAARSGVIEVKNMGPQKLNFQIEALEWLQDAGGKDSYGETRDLIFFPKILSLEAGEEGIVRVGVKAAITPVEKAYRLFVEELPGPQKKQPQGKGAQINILLRFGVAIFVTPIKPQDSLAIEALELSKGTIAITARNTGNRHHLINGVQLRGLDSTGNAVYSLDIADRYLLPGTRKTYTSKLDNGQCKKIAMLAVEVKTDKLNETRKLDVNQAMCS